MRTWIIVAEMDDDGILLKAGVGLGASSVLLSLSKPLLIYDKDFVGTKSPIGIVMSRESKAFLEAPENYTHLIKLSFALSSLGVEGTMPYLKEEGY